MRSPPPGTTTWATSRHDNLRACAATVRCGAAGGLLGKRPRNLPGGEVAGAVVPAGVHGHRGLGRGAPHFSRLAAPLPFAVRPPCPPPSKANLAVERQRLTGIGGSLARMDVGSIVGCEVGASAARRRAAAPTFARAAPLLLLDRPNILPLRQANLAIERHRGRRREWRPRGRRRWRGRRRRRWNCGGCRSRCRHGPRDSRGRGSISNG